MVIWIARTDHPVTKERVVIRSITEVDHEIVISVLLIQKLGDLRKVSI